VRLRVLRRTDGERLCPHVHGCTSTHATVYTDGWKGYNQVERDRQTVCHSDGEWTRDDDEDGIREVHVNIIVNTIEGPQATLRNFLRPLRGVHKNLAGYVAICEFAINLKRIPPSFISALVRVHDF
jgi:transposase-like protein